MNGIQTSPTRFLGPGMLGLWGIATWSVLRLHDASFAQEHSICGPWGCGPTIPALIAAHGFWLLVTIPGALLIGRRLTRGGANALGWICVGLGSIGVGGMAILEWTNRPAVVISGTPPYSAERMLFAIATNVEVPAVPVGLAGLVLLGLGLRSSRAADLRDPACDDFACNAPMPLAVSHPRGRVALGERFTGLSLRDLDGQPMAIPGDSDVRGWVLYFMRAADCSICRAHVRALAEITDRLQETGVGTIVVHPGDDAASRRLANTFGSRLTFASDRCPGTYDRLGLAARNFGLLKGCGTIVLDDRGVVRHVRMRALPFGAFSEIELLEACRSLG